MSAEDLSVDTFGDEHYLADAAYPEETIQFDDLTVVLGSGETSHLNDNLFQRKYEFTVQAFSQSIVAKQALREVAMARPERLSALAEVLLSGYIELHPDEASQALAANAAGYLGFDSKNPCEAVDEDSGRKAILKIAASVASQDCLRTPLAFEISHRLAFNMKSKERSINSIFKLLRRFMHGDTSEGLHSYQTIAKGTEGKKRTRRTKKA